MTWAEWRAASQAQVDAGGLPYGWPSGVPFTACDRAGHHVCLDTGPAPGRHWCETCQAYAR